MDIDSLTADLAESRRRRGRDSPFTISAGLDLALALQNRGRQVDALTLLEELLPDAESCGDEQLLVESKYVLASSQVELGVLGLSDTLVDLSAELSRVFGPGNRRAVLALGLAGLARSRAGDPAGARPLYEQAVHRAEHELGAASPDTIQLRCLLSRALGDAGQLDQARALAEHAVEAAENALGARAIRTLLARSYLVMLQGDRQEADQSRSALEQTREILEELRAQLGSAHPDVLSVEANLGLLLAEGGEPTEAVRLLSKNLDLRRLALDERHPDVLDAQINLAHALRQAERLDESIRALTLTLRELQQALGEDHPAALRAQGNLAMAYLDVGNTRAAVSEGELVLRARQRVLGNTHPDTLLAANNLGAALGATNDREEGRAILAETLELAANVLSSGHPLVATIGGNLQRLSSP